jgi:pimeloyl-ACP methyl ester carboxylesterase
MEPIGTKSARDRDAIRPHVLCDAPIAHDAVAHDPITADPARGGPPPTTEQLEITSAGLPLLNTAFLPGGPGPHPVVVLLHGFPGNDNQLDLAQALRRAGHACVVFHYRGSWGGPGAWSWSNGLDDAAAVVDALRRDARFDPARIVLAGHSYGGFVALQVAAADPRVQAAVSVAGFDFGVARRESRIDPAARLRYRDAWGAQLAALAGTSGVALVDEMLNAAESWSLPEIAPRLAGRPVLLIGTGDRDLVTAAVVHHAPVVAAFRKHGVRVEDTLFDTDHALSDHRVRLARRILGFLDRLT